MKLKPILLCLLASCVLIVCSCKNKKKKRRIKNETETETSAVSGAYQSVNQFLNALNKKDYRAAYETTDGIVWGSFASFSAPTSFGSIYGVQVHQLEDTLSSEPYCKAVVADVTYMDAQSTDRFKEVFYLKEMGEQWKIVKIKVLKKNGGELVQINKIANDPTLNDNVILSKTASYYRRFPEEFISYDNPAIKPRVDVIAKQFYIDNGVAKAFVMIGITSPNNTHASLGRNDAVLFIKRDGAWVLEDINQNSGIGNSFGAYGQVEKFDFFGSRNICAIIKTGYAQSGIIEGYTNIFGVIDDRISVITGYLSDYEDIGNYENGPQKSITVKQSFKLTEGTFRDLVLEYTDNLTHKKTRRTIKFVNNEYVVPEEGE